MTDAIKVLVGKYEDANKEYQTQLLNATPLYNFFIKKYRTGLSDV